MNDDGSSSGVDALRGLGTLAGHVSGVVLCSVVLGAVILGDPRVLWTALTHPEIAGHQWLHVVGHLLISALFWTTAFGVGRTIWRRIRGSKRPRRALALSKGTVMTETIIVLPLALLLYLGLAQLTINNIAAALSNLATFQAARSIWVWAPEVAGDRSFSGMSGAADKARVQAAMVLAPVAAGDYIMSFDGLSSNAEMARAGLVAGQLPFLTSDQGALVNNAVLIGLQAEDPGGVVRLHTRANQVMAVGLDKTSFRLRSARKFTFAYHATTVSPINRPGQVGASLTYLHHQSMPLVGGVFGNIITVGGRTGNYTVYQREMTLATQYDANPLLP